MATPDYETPADDTADAHDRATHDRATHDGDARDGNVHGTDAHGAAAHGADAHDRQVRHHVAFPDTPSESGTPDEWIEAFWAEARLRAKLNPAPAYMGVGTLESLRPPAWAFGDNPRTADELAALVEAGTKTATSSALRDYEAEDAPLPKPGDLGIILDGASRPRALIVTTEVNVVPFNQVDAEHAQAEGEGDRSLQSWRRTHRAYFERHRSGDEAPNDAPGFSQDMPVVLERFKLLVTADGAYHR